MLRFSFCFTLIIFCINQVKSQTIENLRSQQEGEDVILIYDLIGAPENIHKIEVYTSIDNFANPAVLVEGDVGDYILAGSNKRIVWKAKEEVGTFKGNLRWEVRGEIIPSFMNFMNITSGKTLRRGKDFNVQWLEMTRSSPQVNYINFSKKLLRNLALVLLGETNQEAILYLWPIRV